MTTTGFGDLLKAAAEAKYAVIPPSDYAVVCRDAKATKSSTGKDQIKGSFKVAVGPHKGSSLINDLTLTPPEENPNATAIFMRHIKAFGITDEELMALPPRADGGPNIEALCGLLKGRHAIATVIIEPWNDEDRNKISNYKRPSPEQAAAISAAVAEGDPLGAAGTPATPADPMAPAAPAANPLAAKGANDPF